MKLSGRKDSYKSTKTDLTAFLWIFLLINVSGYTFLYKKLVLGWLEF